MAIGISSIVSKSSAAQRYQSSRCELAIYPVVCAAIRWAGWQGGCLQYRDRDRFEVYSYFINYRQTGDKLQPWYAQQSQIKPIGVGLMALTMALALAAADLCRRS
jgi:hypothetical protein